MAVYFCTQIEEEELCSFALLLDFDNIKNKGKQKNKTIFFVLFLRAKNRKIAHKKCPVFSSTKETLRFSSLFHYSHHSFSHFFVKMELSLFEGGRELSQNDSMTGIIVICALGGGSLLLLTVVKLIDDFKKKFSHKSSTTAVTPLKRGLRQQKHAPSFVEYVDMAIPRFFLLDSLSFAQKLRGELIAWHPYISCFTRSPTQCPRVFRVLSLVVSVYVIVFLQMLLYDILHTQTTGTLHDHWLHRVVLMSFLGGALSMLLTAGSHHAIVRVLAADTASWGAVQDSSTQGGMDPGGTADVDSDPTEALLQCSVGEEMGYLLHDLRLYRSELSLEKREKFNGKVFKII
jgi:hypothetical protein